MPEPRGRTYIRVADVTGLTAGRATRFEAAGSAGVLCRSGADVYALEERCSHLGLSLAGGRILGDRLICPHHGAAFDTRTGAPLSFPASRPVKTFATRVVDAGVEVCLDSRCRQEESGDASPDAASSTPAAPASASPLRFKRPGGSRG